LTTNDGATTTVASTSNPSESDGTGWSVNLTCVDLDPSVTVTVDVYFRRQTGGRTAVVNFRLYDGASPIMTAAGSGGSTSTTFSAASYTLSAGEKSSLDNAATPVLRVWGSTSGGGGPTVVQVSAARVNSSTATAAAACSAPPADRRVLKVGAP
jgi:hypothetical protein